MSKERLKRVRREVRYLGRLRKREIWKLSQKRRRYRRGLRGEG